MGLPVPSEQVDQAIRLVRGHRVMFDIDLAALYGVDVKQLKRQVSRNRERFPHDFCFELSKEEQRNLRSQFGTLKRGEHSKYRSYAFTEQGWTESPVAKLKFILSANKWRLYWQREDLKWHEYPELSSSDHLNDLAQETDADPLACFFG